MSVDLVLVCCVALEQYLLFCGVRCGFRCIIYILEQISFLKPVSTDISAFDFQHFSCLLRRIFKMPCVSSPFIVHKFRILITWLVRTAMKTPVYTLGSKYVSCLAKCQGISPLFSRVYHYCFQILVKLLLFCYF